MDQKLRSHLKRQRNATLPRDFRRSRKGDIEGVRRVRGSLQNQRVTRGAHTT